jgi:hypothetical protein
LPRFASTLCAVLQKSRPRFGQLGKYIGLVKQEVELLAGESQPLALFGSGDEAPLEPGEGPTGLLHDESNYT